jgi:hypothetical protein
MVFDTTVSFLEERGKQDGDREGEDLEEGKKIGSSVFCSFFDVPVYRLKPYIWHHDWATLLQSTNPLWAGHLAIGLKLPF